MHLVNPLHCSVPCVRVGISWSFIWHSGDLVLDPYSETSWELYHQRPGICVTCIRDQGLEVVQIVVHRPISLVVEGSFQHVDRVCFCVCREEVQPELLFKVFPGLDGGNTSICFLTEHIFGPLGSMTSFEERESPENPLLFILELLQG